MTTSATPAMSPQALAYLAATDQLHKKQAAYIKQLEAKLQTATTKQAAVAAEPAMVKIAVDALISNGWLQENERADAMTKLANPKTALQSLAQVAAMRDPIREQLGTPVTTKQAAAPERERNATSRPADSVERESDRFWREHVLGAR